MEIKRFAVSITAQAFSDAASQFKENPSADNWMKLDRTMKAHQSATLTPDDTLRQILKNARPEMVVSTLVVLFDDVSESIQKELEEGHVRLIKAKAA